MPVKLVCVSVFDDINFVLCFSVESNQLSSNAIVRIMKSLLVQKSIEEFRASNQVNISLF